MDDRLYGCMDGQTGIGVLWQYISTVHVPLGRLG
jgi:hypothetical protein